MLAVAADTIGEACVPTVHRFGPYRFFFYSDENRRTFEPPHVHVWSNGQDRDLLAVASQPP